MLGLKKYYNRIYTNINNNNKRINIYNMLKMEEIQ